MSIVRVQSNFATAGNANAALTCAFPANVTAGNLIVVCIEFWNSGITETVTDGLSNSYTQVDTYSSNGSYIASMFYAKNITGGACTVTATPSASAYRSMVIMEYSGATTTPLDSSAKTTGSSTTPSTGSITVSQAGDLLVATFSTFSTWGSVTANNFNVVAANSSNVTPSIVVVDVIADTAKNPTVMLGASDLWASIGASFKAVSAGGGGGGGLVANTGMRGGMI